MDTKEIQAEAAAFIDEFSANFHGKPLSLAIGDPIDEMVIRAVALDGITRLQETGDWETFNVVFGIAVALGAFLQYKGRFDIMKLRGAVQ